MSLVRLFVLGIVRLHGRAHGYLVRSTLHAWSVDKWSSVKPGSIYHALRQLTKERKLRIVSIEDSTEGPERTVYELTEQGEAEFRQLLDEALTSIDLELLGAGIAFMQALPRAHAADQLRKRQQQMEEVNEYLQSLRSSYPGPNDPEPLKELLGLWGTFFESGAAWTAGLIERLEAGAYTMLDDVASEAPR
jgi:DNA-binding PadR family transcriptional regulator